METSLAPSEGQSNDVPRWGSNPLLDLADGGQNEPCQDRELHFVVVTQLLFFPLALGCGLAERGSFIQLGSAKAAFAGDRA